MATPFQFADLSDAETTVVTTEPKSFSPLFTQRLETEGEAPETGFRPMGSQNPRPQSQAPRPMAQSIRPKKAAKARPQIDPAELKKIKDEAIKAGVSEGYAQGYQEGMQAGKREGSQALLEQSKALRRLLAALQGAEKQLFDAVKDDLLTIVCTLPKRIIRQELKMEPRVVTKIVTSLLQELPRQRRVEVLLNPEDLQLLRDHKIDTQSDNHGDVQLRASADLSRGSIHLVTDGGHIDASIETQLKTLEEQARQWIKGNQDPTNGGV